MILAAAQSLSRPVAILRFSSIGTAEPSHMCDWNSGFLPALTRSVEIASSGLTNPSSLSLGQWSVCSATVNGYFSAMTWANSASATAPVTMSLTPRPEPNSAPPVENWMMPSLPASANPLIAALIVSDEVQLMAGNAYELSLARLSISL